jgi:hypothetical protein
MDSEQLNVNEVKDKDTKKKEAIEKEHGDLFQVTNNIYKLMNIKIALILLFVYIILNFDRFIEHGLSKLVSNIYDYPNDKITNKGIILNGVILSVMYIILDMLDKKKII